MTEEMDKAYDVSAQSVNGESPLSGYRILFLGSSVTYGSAAGGVSFADDIAARNNVQMYKEAVSGTTLVRGKNSYIERLEQIDRNLQFDLVVCQLSTNDAKKEKPLGTPSHSDAPDTNTICGAIVHIIRYVRETWNCPIVFYTNSYYESARYRAMVDAMREIATRYHVGLINLYDDDAFNAITEEERARFMKDAIHPTRVGYLEWWTPKIEAYLIKSIREAM